MMRTVIIIFDITFILLIGTRTCGGDGLSGPISAKTKDADRSCTINLSACEIKAEASILQNLKGEKGDQGPPGLAGYPGMRGFPGMRGDKGEKGSPGVKGEIGEKGPYGIPGYPGTPGLQGYKGDKGEIGIAGPPGEKRHAGSPGIPGLNAVCDVRCPPIYNSDEAEAKIESEDDIGSQQRPSDYPCYMIRYEGEFKDKIWVFPGPKKFEVKCKGPPTHHTCLIIPELAMSAIQEKAFHSREDQTENFWMSNYFDARSNKRFDLTQFYNNINKTQLSWLRNKTKQVTQTIRYHCKNSYVMDSFFTNLQLYSWNDVRIGPDPTDYSPVSWTVLPGAKNECTPDAPIDEWRYTDITVRGSTDRLPIIDFYIRDNRPEDQYFYLELRELCFG